MYALVALGRIAVDLGDIVQSIDINPFVVLPRGGFALDALVVPERRGESCCSDFLQQENGDGG